MSDRWGSEEPPESHSHRHRGVTDRVFPGLLWCVSCAHPDDALLPSGWEEPSAHGFWICGVGPRQICGRCGFTLCPLYQVTNSFNKICFCKIIWEQNHGRRNYLDVGFIVCESAEFMTLIPDWWACHKGVNEIWSKLWPYISICVLLLDWFLSLNGT